MKYLLKLLIIILFITISTAYAQKETPELTQMYVFRGSGYSVSFPDDWYSASEEGRFYLTNDEYILDFDFFLPALQEERDYPMGDIQALAEEIFYAGGGTIPLDWNAVQSSEVDGETVYEFAFSNINTDGSTFPTVYYARLMEDGTYVNGYLYPGSGTAPVPPTLRDVGAAIIANFKSNIVSEPAESSAPFEFEKQYTFASDYAIYFPEHWDVYLDAEELAVLFNGSTTLKFDFYYPELLAERSIPANDLIGAAEAVFSPADETVIFDPKIITTLMVENQKVVSFDFLESDLYPITFIALYQPDGTLVIGYLFPTFGSDPVSVEDRDTALQILASVGPVTE